MKPDWKTVLIGGIAGLGAAIKIDLEAWKQSNGAPFDWKLAAQRWAKGFVIGAAGAAGITGTGALFNTNA